MVQEVRDDCRGPLMSIVVVLVIQSALPILSALITLLASEMLTCSTAFNAGLWSAVNSPVAVASACL